MSALRAAANAKPVVVLKAGRKPAGNRAALTHSGSIVGSDDVFDAALRRAGAVRVDSFVQLFSAAKCLASRYRPVGRRLAIVTNGGGPGVLAADWVSEIRLRTGQPDRRAGRRCGRRCRRWRPLSDLIDISEEATPEPVHAPRCWPPPRRGRSTACWRSTRPSTAWTVAPWPWRWRT
jgi:acetyltransferase